MTEDRICKYCGTQCQSVKENDGKYICVRCKDGIRWLAGATIAGAKILNEMGYVRKNVERI